MRRIISSEGFKHRKQQAWYASRRPDVLLRDQVISESLRNLRENFTNRRVSQPITQLTLCFLSKYKALEHPILTQTFFGKGTLSYWYFIFHIEVLQKITNDKFARHIEDPPNVCVTSKIFPENTHLSSLFLSHLQSTDYLLRHLTFLCRMNTRGIELDEAERNILSLFPIAPIS